MEKYYNECVQNLDYQIVSVRARTALIADVFAIALFF